MPNAVQQHAVTIRELIQETARRLGFSETSIAAKVAKHEGGARENGDDISVLDILPEIHDLHDYVVPHATQNGFYPAVEVRLRLVELPERRLGPLRPGVPASSVLPCIRSRPAMHRPGRPLRGLCAATRWRSPTAVSTSSTAATPTF